MPKSETDMVFAAWSRYRTATRNLIGYRYTEMEPWAYARLESDLKYISEKAEQRELAHA